MVIRSKIRTEISSGNGIVTVEPVRTSDDRPRHQGMVVLSEPLSHYIADSTVFANDTYGVAMNQDGTFGGTPSGIYNGNDTSWWTAQDVVGANIDVSSSERANTGTYSLKIDTPALNDVWELDSGITQDLTSFQAISMAVNVDKNWSTDSIEIYGWDGAAEVGSRVRLEDYITESDFDVWQPISIPLADLGLTNLSITSIRMELVNKTGSPPVFYLDDIQFEETGGGIEFKGIAPKIDRPYLVDAVIITFAGPHAATVTDGTVPGLTFSSILGAGNLTNGIVLQSKVNGVREFAITFKSIGDFLAVGFQINSIVSDGTDTQICLIQEFFEPLVLLGNSEGNNLNLTIQDDLTGLHRVTAFIRGRSEIRKDTSISSNRRNL